MSWLREFLDRRRAGVVRRREVDQAIRDGRLAEYHRENHGGTFVMDVEWIRSEELRTDRLGPSQDDVEDPVRVDTERWRPRRTLG